MDKSKHVLKCSDFLLIAAFYMIVWTRVVNLQIHMAIQVGSIPGFLIIEASLLLRA